MSSLITTRVVVPINRTILSFLLVDIIVSEKVRDARLSEGLARRVIESRAIICVHCSIAIEVIRLIAAVCISYISLLQSLHFYVVISCDSSVYTNVADRLDD